MQPAVSVLAGTPLYAWCMLAGLIWQGVRSLRTHGQPVWRVLFVPVIFTMTGLLLLAGKPFMGLPSVLAWGVCFAVLVPAGLKIRPRLAGRDAAGGRVVLAGSPVPLLRNMVVFALQYATAASLALRPDMQPQIAVVACVISGASAGYFTGWTCGFLMACRKV